MDYFIAIRSYNRFLEIGQKTLQVLNAYQIPKSRICIFVSDSQQLDLYSAHVPRNMYGHLIIAEQGISNVCRFISNYFPENYPVVCMDDDIQTFQHLDGDKLRKLPCLEAVIQRGFQLCKENALTLWGIYPTANPYYMKPDESFNLKFIIGNFYGVFNCREVENAITVNYKEDYIRTLEHSIRVGGVVRLNSICAKTFMGSAGGIGLSIAQRLNENKRVSELLVETYSGLVRLNRNRDGEILLANNIKSHQIPGKKNPTLIIPNVDSLVLMKRDEEISKELVEELSILRLALEKTPLKWNSKRKNSGAGYTQVFGIVDRRHRGKGQCKNNEIYDTVWAQLQKIGARFIPTVWNACQVNYNYKSHPHKDKNNHGDSTIVSFGDYTGGELCLETGFMVDTKNNPFVFNGSKTTHWNKDIIGNKYSVVYFHSKVAPVLCDDIEKHKIIKNVSKTKTSFIWDYLIIDEELPDKVLAVRCSICYKAFTWKCENGSSSIRKHILSHQN
jgi:hypothetical protein